MVPKARPEYPPGNDEPVRRLCLVCGPTPMMLWTSHGGCARRESACRQVVYEPFEYD
jgi:hypothetical protein